MLQLKFGILLSFFSTSLLAVWNFDTISGVQVHYYVPKATKTLTNKSHKRALMINLHGCSQKAEDLKKDGNWEMTADEYNMIVALPKVPNGGVLSGCWDYYGADHTPTNRHNSALLSLVKELTQKSELLIDSQQVYLSGLSSGGGETMVLGCLAPDIFAGIGINAGPSTGTSSSEISRPSTTYDLMFDTCKKLGVAKSDSFKTQLTSIIYGNNDFIVNTAFNTNNAEIMKTLYDAQNKSTFDTKKLVGTSNEGSGTLWSDAKGPRVSLIMNKNLGHNWPAGQGGNGGNFINKKSINYPNYLASFFYTNNIRAKNVQLPEVLIDQIEVKDSKFFITGKTTIAKELIKNILVQVKNKSSNTLVDSFHLAIARDQSLSGFSKKLTDGEYDFSLIVQNAFGQKKAIKRTSWMGDVFGNNLPQLVNTNFSTVSGCLFLNGQAYNNGPDKVIGVEIFLNGSLLTVTTVENTKWNFQSCNLPRGKQQLKVLAVNESGVESNTFEQEISLQLKEATSTLQEHMESKRLKWEDYGSYYLRHGHHRFTLKLGDNGLWIE